MDSTISLAPTPHQKMMAAATVVLTRVLGDRVYGGTVPQRVKAQRRAAGKVAKRSRKINRGR